MVLYSALKPPCPTAAIFYACSFNLCSMISSWLCLDGRWSWLFSSSGTAADCFHREVWRPILGPWGWPLSCLPDLVADFCESGDYCFSICLDQFCKDVVNSSWFPFLQWLYCSLNFFRKDGWLYSVFVWGQVSTDESPLVLQLYSSQQYSVHRFSISNSSVRHFPVWQTSEW